MEDKGQERLQSNLFRDAKGYGKIFAERINAGRILIMYMIEGHVKSSELYKLQTKPL